jgi:hypothetical protein
MPLSSLNTLNNLQSLDGSTNAQPSSSATPQASTTNSGPSWLTGTLAQIAIILLGLLLIAGGIFSFEKVQDVTKTVAKTASKAAVAA